MKYPVYYMNRETREVFIRSSDTDVAVFQVWYADEYNCDRIQRQRRASNKEECDCWLQEYDQVTEEDFLDVAVDLCYDIKRISQRIMMKYDTCKYLTEKLEKLKNKHNQ